MLFADILQNVDTYYSNKLKTYGAEHRGVDWNSTESQHLRFDQLLKIVDTSAQFSVNDYGCGYGALAPYMAQQGYHFTYSGFDISEAMIEQAKVVLSDVGNCTLFSDPTKLSAADYTIASGIFNVKMETGTQRWKDYIENTLVTLASISSQGFAFNMLTAYSDADRMRPDLYYSDPLYFFDFCRKNFSRHVALLHDYKLYEFTMLVRLTV